MKRILVIDDTPEVRDLIVKVIQLFLPDESYVVAAANGQEGLAEIMHPDRVFDLVISDILMPEMAADEMFRQAIAAGKNLPPVILVSGTPNELARCLAVFPEGTRVEFLNKPIILKDLADLIKDMVK